MLMFEHLAESTVPKYSLTEPLALLLTYFIMEITQGVLVV